MSAGQSCKRQSRGPEPEVIQQGAIRTYLLRIWIPIGENNPSVVLTSCLSSLAALSQSAINNLTSGLTEQQDWFQAALTGEEKAVDMQVQCKYQ